MEGAATTPPAPAYKVSTFAETQKEISVETPAVTTQEPATPAVDGSQAQTTPDSTQPAAQQPAAAEAQTPEENVSSINIGFGEEPNQQAAAADTAAAPDQPKTPPTFNWQEEIKKIPRSELLKAAGVNEFAIEIDEYMGKGGQPLDYLQAKSVDYNKVSDEEIVKSDLHKKYPNLTPEEVHRLFTKKYGTTEYATDDEKQDAELVLKTDAYTARQQLISEQQKFKIPDAVIPQQKDEAYEQWKQQQANQPAAMEKLSRYYNEHQATKSLNESKRVTINLGEGVAPFHFAVDKPEVITQVLTDDGTGWNKLTSTETGEPDVPKQQLITLFAANPQQFIAGIFNYGIKMGEKKLVKEGQNPQKPQAVIASMEGNQTATYRVGTYGGGAK